MPGDPKECREHAKRCWALASQTQNPVLRESLVDLAQKWSVVAVDLEATQRLLDTWGDPRASTGCIGADDGGTRRFAENLDAIPVPSKASQSHNR
jgi:hypothetical protein